MSLQTVTVQLPEKLYQQVQRRAYQMHRSIEDELVAVVAAVLPALDDLPADMIDALANLTLLTDDELWQAANSTLSKNESEQMQALIQKQQQAGLTPPENEAANRLAYVYDRTMLIRAQAAVLLKERGYDVSTLK